MNKLNILNNEEVRINSVELVDIINKFRSEEGNKKELLHKNFMAKIKKEVEVLESLNLNNGLNFKLVKYKDSKGEDRPCYSLNRDGMLQMLNLESTLVRYKTIEYINALEDKVKSPQLTVKQQLQLSILNGDEIERVSSLKAYEALVVEEATKPLVEEIEHKENVIVGLVDDIDLCTKRQRINQIIRYGAKGRYVERWNLLYSEFEKKYHVDIKRRISSCDIKPKIKNKMDYIDRVMNMISQLYELSCKLFENEVEKLKEEWIETIER